MPKNLTDFDSSAKGTVPTVIPFPAGLSRPDQARDWANSLASAVAYAGLTHVANAKLPPGLFEELYDSEAIRDPPPLPDHPTYSDACKHRSMRDEVRKRRAHNERVNKQAESWFKTKNHEFFILKTHPGLRDMLRDRCALGGEDKGYFDGVAAMTFVDRWCKKMHGYHPHHDFYQRCLETILKMTLPTGSSCL